MTVAVLSTVTGGLYYGEILQGITREVATAGGRVVLLQTLDAGRSRDAVLGVPEFATQTGWDHTDGVISISGAADRAFLEQHRAAGRPVVLASESLEGFASASPDNVEGVHAAIDHLVEHGHERIGFAANLVQTDMRERHEAYRLALLAHGIDPDPAWMFEASDNGEIGGRGVGAALVAAGLPVTALVAATDRNAIGVMEALAEARVSVPGDLAVVGFDDIERGSFVSPTLSTVCQHFDEVGALAARLVLAQLAGERVGFHTHRPSSSFVPRESCGCVVAGGAPAAPAVGSDVTGLVVRLRTLLLPGRVEPDAEAVLAREVAAFSAAVTQAAAAGHDLTSARVKDLAALVRRFEPLPEMLRRVVEAVTSHLYALATGPPPLPAAGSAVLARCAAQVSAALWQAQAQAYLERSARTEAALHEQFEIGMRLLDRDHADPRRLEWMSETLVRAGCLALWDGDPVAGMLRVAGVYDPDQALTSLGAPVLAVEQFPPVAVMACGDAQDGRLTYVIPVRVRGRDWGLLAVVGEIDATAATGRQTYDQWAALLASSFEQDALQASIRGSEERYSLVARATNDGLWDWDIANDTIYYSARCNELLGGGQPAGNDTPSRWFDAVHPDDLGQLRRILAEAAIEERRPVELEHRVRGADGRYHHLLCRALPVGPARGAARRIVGSLSDIDLRKQLEEKLRQSALHDEVTGLPNRKLFIERLAAAIAQADRAPRPQFAVVFLDLDGFKLVNDTLGHQIGDRLLAEVGERLRASLRHVDIAARFGGDEFAVLLHDTELTAVPEVVVRIQHALAKPLVLDGHEVVVTASAGITTSEAGYTDAEDVLRDADIAMYHAKAHLRGSHAVFETGMQVDGTAQPGFQQGLHHALNLWQLKLRYQPIIELDVNAVVRFEALVRWHHSERGLLEPTEFLAVTEDTGLIVEMGRSVLEEVCRQLAEWQLSSPLAHVSVNISEREFWDQGLLLHLRYCLEHFGVAPDSLVLEVVESVLVRKPDLAAAVLRELRELGIGIHIDNFGAAESSLHALRLFEVQAVKIDGSFIEDVAGDARTAALVKTILALGSSLGIDVIAEGVETQDQLNRLQEMGCRTAQGLRFSGPVDVATATAMLGQAHLSTFTP